MLWSTFNDLQDEVSKALDRSTTAGRGEGRGSGGASAEDYGGSNRWSELSGQKERRRVRYEGWRKESKESH
jgi:hypothetical protein